MTLANHATDSPVYGWDWSATTHGDSHVAGEHLRTDDERALVESLVRSLRPGIVLGGGKGLQGWSTSLDCFDSDGFRLGRVYYGGRPDAHVLSTSAAADVSRDRVTSYSAKTARVDTRVDTLADFDALSGVLEDAASRYGSIIDTYERRVRGESLGRTVYLGAPSSRIRVRLYEKWLESPGQYVAGTNRVEVQLRPDSRAKGKVSSWSRADTFCASKVTRDLASQLGSELATPGSLQVRRGTPDLERSLAAMGDQYGKAVRSWLSVSGGDVGAVLDHLGVPD